jgi:hypothetical protein
MGPILAGRGQKRRHLDLVMLAEALVYAMSLGAAPPGFRRNLPAAIGLWSRGVRQAKAWVPHIGNTRGLIDAAIDDFAERRAVALLGSGPLFDVPLEALARTFGRVHLVDHAHLSTIKERTRRYDNIEPHWRELSAARTPDPLGFLAGMQDLDWVISVNLLSQLARTAPEGMQRQVVDAHLAQLTALPCRTTLITDVNYRVVDRGGRVVDEADMLFGRDMPAPDLTWKWEVAPFGEESHEARRVHQVAAWLDWTEI